MQSTANVIMGGPKMAQKILPNAQKTLKTKARATTT
jgi:hypothetical protein